MNEMARTATNVWKLAAVNKTLISVDEECVQEYVTDTLDSVHDYYVGCVLDDGHVSLLAISTHSNEGAGEKE